MYYRKSKSSIYQNSALLRSLTKIPKYPFTYILTYLKTTGWFREAHTF